jgi:amidophosphoribosyltransferase
MAIASIYNSNPESNCVDSLYNAIFNINHLGQGHCGIVSLNENGFSEEYKTGLVRELKLPWNMDGYCGLGNVNKIPDGQPLTIYDSGNLGNFALTFDGFIINDDDLRKELGGGFRSPYHAEIAGRLISQGKDIPDGIKTLANKIKGAFCIGIITEEGKSYAARCPLGTKPLIYGHHRNDEHGIITESRAFRKIGMIPERDIEPGEIVYIDDLGIHPAGRIEGRDRKICSFLWGYYSWVDSVIEGIPVKRVRKRAAAHLAEKDKKDGLKFDIVSSIEDSGKAYGEGYALAAEMPYLSTVIKYPYFQRSYDQRTQEKRDNEASGKVSTVDEDVKGNVIVINDDSVRRGTVTKFPVRYLRSAGAKEIHLRIGTPRNRAYCRFDFREDPDDSLIANRLKTDKEIAEIMDVDSIKFIEVDEFVDSIIRDSDLKEENLCLGCYTGDFSFLD